MAGGVGSGWLLDVDGDLVLVWLVGKLETGRDETETLLSTKFCCTNVELVGSDVTVVVVGDSTGKERCVGEWEGQVA